MQKAIGRGHWNSLFYWRHVYIGRIIQIQWVGILYIWVLSYQTFWEEDLKHWTYFGLCSIKIVLLEELTFYTCGEPVASRKSSQTVKIVTFVWCVKLSPSPCSLFEHVIWISFNTLKDVRKIKCSKTVSNQLCLTSASKIENLSILHETRFLSLFRQIIINNCI